MKKERQSLAIDLDALFPGEELVIGSTTVIIRPLSIYQISNISKQLKGMGAVLSKEGITWDNFAEKQSIFTIAVCLIDSFPEVLEEASNIELEDLQLLPLESIVLILNKVIEVNLKSKDELTKNFKSLTEKLVTQIGNLQPEPKKNKK